jgi:hypothetical protein
MTCFSWLDSNYMKTSKREKVTFMRKPWCSSIQLKSSVASLSRTLSNSVLDSHCMCFVCVCVCVVGVFMYVWCVHVNLCLAGSAWIELHLAGFSILMSRCIHVDRRENVKISAVCVCVFVTCILTATSRLIERRRFPVFSRTDNMHTIVTFVYEAFSC